MTPDDGFLKAALIIAELKASFGTRPHRLLKALVGAEMQSASAADPSDLCGRLADAMGLSSGARARWLGEAAWRTEQSIARAAGAGLIPLTWTDPRYPDWLREIHDPPVVLWVSGDVAVLQRPAVGVVGSRQATPAGLAVGKRLAAGLAEAGLVVVSGMARGVDGAAHEGALQGRGPTVAVLGSGADTIYPPSHLKLARAIRESGAIVSELAPGTPPRPAHFPLRNRIISGLSKAVVVVEASERSGSLITARLALEQGRDVLAVPGNILSGQHRGCHALIKDGARLVETVEDVLDEIHWRPPAAVAAGDKPVPVSELEAAMALGEAYSADDLAERIGRSGAELLATIGALELEGRIARLPGGAFIRLDASVTDRRNSERDI